MFLKYTFIQVNIKIVYQRGIVFFGVLYIIYIMYQLVLTIFSYKCYYLKIAK